MPESGGGRVERAVVEYSAELRARAVDELELLPEGTAIVEMVGDYAVMREQAPACQSHVGSMLHRQ